MVEDAEGTENGIPYMDFDDTNAVAYLHYRGHKFVPFKKEGGRVCFRVYGEGIRLHIDEMYQNKEVKVQDFVKCTKAVRNSLFVTKGMT